MKRRPLIAGNWKMNKNIAEALEFVTELEKKFAGTSEVDIALFPSFVCLDALSREVETVLLGAQNLGAEASGAFTGEVSAPMLQKLVKLVLVGHSERRHIFGETHDMLNRKVGMALEYGMTPVLCVGETLEQRDADLTLSVIEEQLTSGLSGFTAQQADSVIIAYEPVWAIGTGRTATPDQAQTVHAFIRDILKKIAENPDCVRILYGGSVKPANCVELLEKSDIDGALIGGASLHVDNFSDIIHHSIRLVR